MTDLGPEAVPPTAPREGALAEDTLAEQHPVLRRLASDSTVGAGVRRGALWAVGSRAGSQFIQFLGTVVTARILLPSDYGKAAVVVPIVAFANIFTTLGLGSAVIHARRVTEKLLSTAFWVNFVTGLLLTAVVAALSVPLARLFRIPDLVPLLCLASVLFSVNVRIVHTALLERTMRFKQIAIGETVSGALGIAATIVTALMGAGAYSLILGPIVTQVVLSVWMWAVVRWTPRARPDRQSVRELWEFSRGLTGFQTLNFWSRNADNLLLARFVSLAELGNYSRSYNLMKLPVTQMNTMMGRVLFPALTRLRDDRPRLGQAWLRSLSTAGAAVAPVTFGMAVAAPAMIEVLFGRRWLGMVTVLELLAVSALPQTLTTTVGGLLRATGATDVLFRLGLLTSSLSLVAMLIGLPWGSVGVAAALAVKFYLEVGISLPRCFAQTGLGWRDLGRAMRGVWLSCLALAGSGLLVRLTLSDRLPAWQLLILQVLACGAGYVSVLWLVDRQPLVLAWSGLRALSRRSGRGTAPEPPVVPI